MRKIAVALIALLATSFAMAQSVPNGTITLGEVWTPLQWNNAWKAKVDYPATSAIPLFTWSTAGRPLTPSVGWFGYNTTLGLTEWWNGSAWISGGGGGSGAPGGATYTTQYNAGSGAFGGVGPGTTGYPLVSTGGSSPPAFSQIGSAALGSGAALANLGLTGNQGTGVLLQHSTGTATSGHCVEFDASGNTVDAGGTCTTGGSSGVVTSGTANNVTYYASTGTTVSGLANGTTGQVLTSAGSSSPPAWTTFTASASGYVYAAAACDGSTDDTTTIQNAINTAESGNAKIVLLPAGTCKVGPLSIAFANGVWLQGQGMFATTLAFTGTTTNAISVTNGLFNKISDLSITQLSGTPTAGFAIALTGGESNMVTNVRIGATGTTAATGAMWSGIEVTETNDILTNINIYYMLGTNGILFTGTGYGLFVNNYIANPTYCSGCGATPTANNTNFVHITQSSNANSLQMFNVSAINGGACLVVNGTSSSQGIISQGTTVDCDHNTVASGSAAVQLVNGDDFQLVDSWFSSVNPYGGGAANLISVGASYSGEVIINSSRIFGATGNGVLLAGGTNTIISSNIISENGQAGAGTYNGVSVGANVNNFVISDNIFGNVGGDTQYCGALVNAGTSNYYNIIGNGGGGETSGNIVCDGGSGANKSVLGNQSGSGGGGGGVSTVTNTDGTMNITGSSAVTVSLNPSHSNFWIAAQTFSNNVTLGTTSFSAGLIAPGGGGKLMISNDTTGATYLGALGGTLVSKANLQPNTNNAESLGVPGTTWSDVYSVLGNFSGALTTNITGSTQCVQANSSGVLSGTGATCGSGGGGAVSSVSNSDGSLTVTPTTGAVVASINPAHTTTYSAPQYFAGGIQIGTSGAAGIYSGPGGGIQMIANDTSGNTIVGFTSHSITMDSSIQPYSNNVVSDGVSAARWSDVYSVLGNFSGALTTNITGSTQCVTANSAGVLSGTGASCGGSGGVTSLTAGANINLSASTGAVTVSVPSTITTATVTATSALNCNSTCAMNALTATSFAIPNNGVIKTQSGNNIISGGTAFGTIISTGGGSGIILNGLTVPDGDNTFQLGQSSDRWTEVWAVNGLIQTSDERQKTEVADEPLGLWFIWKLRPVSYIWKDKPLDEPHHGFIAQEVEKALDGAPFAGLVRPKTSAEFYGMVYAEFTASLTEGEQQLIIWCAGLSLSVFLLVLWNIGLTITIIRRRA